MKQLIAHNLNQDVLFILFCCRKLLADTSIGELDDLLTENLNWNFILSMAGMHGIAGLLYVKLSQCSNIGRVPEDVLEKLKQTHRLNMFRNLLYSREFNSIANNFNGANIRILPLKGIAFLQSMYARNIALRSLSDMDILVEKINVGRAEKILADMGYLKIKTGPRNSRRAFHSNFSRSRDKFPIIVELHWDIDFSDSPFNINIAELWERSESVSAGDFSYYRLSIEDSIIFNSFHILREIRKGPDVLLPLKNFCDIAMIITQSGDQINWDCIIQRSLKYNVLRPVAFVLILVQELLEVKTIPPVIFDTLRNAGYQTDFSCCAVEEYIFPPQDRDNKMLPFWFVELADHKKLQSKAKVFISLPKIILNLYNAQYYGRSNHSVMIKFLLIAYYYAIKIIKTAVFYIVSPRKAIMLKKNLIIANRKTKEVINWIRG